MRLKSYFAATVEEAIALASRELGDEAMLIYSRETLPEARYLGQYEVVFALEAEAAPGGAAATAGGAAGGMAGGAAGGMAGGMAGGRDEGAARGGAAMEAAWTSGAGQSRGGEEAGVRALEAEMAGLRAQFGRMERLLLRSAGAAAAARWSERGEALHQELLEQELPEDVAIEVVSAVEAGAGPGRAWRREDAVAQLAAALAPAVRGGAGWERCRAHALVGPAGAGKTTMLVKLAVLLGLEQRLPVMLVSLDSQRIGGAEQLKTFAQILGVPFAVADHRHGLVRLLDNEAKRSLLLLDTPGFSEQDLAAWSWLPAVLAGREEVGVHLTLPAYGRTRECARMMRRYAPFSPSSLLLTHLDDSEAIGGLLGELLRRGLPLSYCGTGPAIPEDIQEGGAEWLARRLLSRGGEAARPAPAEGASWATA